MGQEISGQLVTLCGSAAAGVCLGLIYDLLRVLRRRTKSRMLVILFDFLFWLCAAFVLFTLGMSFGGGSLGIITLLFSVIGAAVYMLTLSGTAMTVFGRLCDLTDALLAPLRKIMNTSQSITKKLFKKIQDWFKLKKMQNADRRKGDINEEQGTADTSYSNSACDDLRRGTDAFGTQPLSGGGELGSGAPGGDSGA